MTEQASASTQPQSSAEENRSEQLAETACLAAHAAFGMDPGQMAQALRKINSLSPVKRIEAFGKITGLFLKMRDIERQKAATVSLIACEVLCETLPKPERGDPDEPHWRRIRNAMRALARNGEDAELALRRCWAFKAPEPGGQFAALGGEALPPRIVKKCADICQMLGLEKAERKTAGQKPA